jgi:hypothetical protein
MKRLVILFAIVFAFQAQNVLAQDELMKELEETEKKETDYAFQTFKGTRLVNGHSVETKAKGTLEFIFAHRFGNVRGGISEMYGLDQAYVRLGLDYGITDYLSVSIGRNSVDKTMDGYVKIKALRQSKGARNFPVTVTLLGGSGYQTSLKKLKDSRLDFKNVYRLSYVAQALIARKFTPKLSLQVMPTFVHKNAAYKTYEDNDQIAIGVGGRIKVTRSIALTSEYYYRLDPHENTPYHNTLGFGIDIETGGHVFQLVITNTQKLTERAFITETEDDFGSGDVHLGFNVTRTFQMKGKR